jgi:hypothetical chaperone protein
MVALGLDFGTSNSGAAIYNGSEVQLLPLDPKNVIPEVVKTILYLTHEHKPYIGQEAVEQYYRENVGRLRRFVKKWVGEVEYRGADMYYVTDLYAFIDELQPGRLFQFLKTALRQPGYEGTRVFDRHYSTGELIALYLREIKLRAETVLDKRITHVTLGRPVHFSANPDLDLKAEMNLREAAKEAGFKHIGMELEPVAAALYYEKTLSHPQTALIFDFGGGTLDITVVRLGEPRKREILANGGIDVAGSDFDRTIIQRRLLRHFGDGQVDLHPELRELVNSVSDWMALPELSTPVNHQNILRAVKNKVAPVQLKALESLIFNDLAFSFYRAVEESKINLSSQGAVTIQIHEKDLNIWELYTRIQFERDIQGYQGQVENVIVQTLAAAHLEPGQIDAVVKTGGSSSIPIFHSLLARLFGVEKISQSSPFSSVTAGLAIRASQ